MLAYVSARCPDTSIPWLPDAGGEVAFIPPIINKLAFDLKSTPKPKKKDHQKKDKKGGGGGANTSTST